MHAARSLWFGAMLPRQKTIACAAAAAACLALGACARGDGASGDARKGGSIIVGATAPPDSLDPALSRSPQARQALWLAYTPPLTYRRGEGAEGTEIVPGVAEKLPEVSEDGTRYSFKVREGLRYSDGTPVRASDFEHTIKRVIRLGAGGALYAGIEGAEEYSKATAESADITGIEANDRERQVTVQLTGRDATFKDRLALGFAGMVPAKTPFEDLTDKPPPGIGPYRITESRPQEFVMEQTRGFDLPDIPEGNIQRITTRVVKEEEAQARQVIEGRLDYMQGSLPVELLPEIRSKYKDRYAEHPTLSSLYFFFNQRTPPFDNEKVRKAVNLALDRQALSRLFAGRLEPRCNFVPRGLRAYRPIDPCPYGDPGMSGDPERARQLIEDSGEKGKAVTVYADARANHREIGRYYTGLLDKIGLDAKLKVVARLRGGRRARAQTGVVSFTADIPHPLPFMAVLEGDVLDTEVEERLVDLAGEPDEESATEGYADLDRVVVENAYAAPLGAQRLGTFLSERMDSENCSLFHQVYGTDYSSLCLR